MSPLDEAFSRVGSVVRVVLFDYDSTIAQVPIDWPKARIAYADYLAQRFPNLEMPEGGRVDEMEALALHYAPEEKAIIFQYRHEVESALDGSHDPLDEVCRFVRKLVDGGGVRLFIISNNLHRTVEGGLEQMGLSNAFEAILGVDDVGVPKPETRAFTLLQESYGLSAEDCIFIGDNDRTDGGFCRALGIPFINITENKT